MSNNGVHVYKSACRMCHGGCGVLVHVKDGIITKIRGDPESPLNKGRMCIKGAASLEHVYHPDRLKYPLKRVGARGAGEWERVSWDDAYDIIATKLEQIKAENGPESIALGTGTGRHHCLWVGRFANALGTPNWCEPGHAQCFLPRIHTCLMTIGDKPISDYYGDVNPACVLVWGHNPVITGPDGELQFHSRKLLRSETKFIVVDPRRTQVAENAAVWLQLRPGTDDALALSLLNVIINERLYDEEFVNKWTYGFDKLAVRVRDCTPEWAEEITWVPAAKIKTAARLFAETKPATLEWGCAIEHTPNCLQTVRAVSLLPVITGNLDVPGGWVFGSHGLGEFPFLHESLPDEITQKRLGAEQFRVLARTNSAHIPALFKAMRTGDPYPIRAFLVFGNNPLLTYADSKSVFESLMQLDFFSVMELYMTPSAQLADLVLPAASWLELDAATGFPSVAENVVLAQKKIVQIGECKQDELVFSELARRMDLPVGQEMPEEIYDAQLAHHFGITFKELQERGFVEKPQSYFKYETSGFDTPTGKVELYSTELEKLGYDPLPYFAEPPESPFSDPVTARDYPYILITGARSQNYFTSEYRQIPKLRKGHPDPLVEIHPETAENLGISDGEWVWIETKRGGIKQKARITDGIDPRVVHVEFGWWFPEKRDAEYGVWESNANVLTNQDPPYDPAMGTYQLRALLCQVRKME